MTELCTLSWNCSFANVDQLTQHCQSNRLCRRALREPDKSPANILKLGCTLELADAQALLLKTVIRRTLWMPFITRKIDPPTATLIHKKNNHSDYVVSNQCGSNMPHMTEHWCQALRKVRNYTARWKGLSASNWKCKNRDNAFWICILHSPLHSALNTMFSNGIKGPDGGGRGRWWYKVTFLR